MLTPTQNIAYLSGLRNRVLDNATLLRDEKPREWLCNSGDYILVVRWQQGFLGVGVDETEYEVYQDIKIVAVDKELTSADTIIPFSRVIEFMDWTIDDDDWFE